MTTRYYAEEPCEHGKMDCRYSVPCGEVHAYVKTCGLDCVRCSGGVRRELTIDYEAALASWEASRDTLLSDAEAIHFAVDAALSGDPQ